MPKYLPEQQSTIITGRLRQFFPHSWPKLWIYSLLFLCSMEIIISMTTYISLRHPSCASKLFTIAYLKALLVSFIHTCYYTAVIYVTYVSDDDTVKTTLFHLILPCKGKSLFFWCLLPRRQYRYQKWIQQGIFKF